MPQRSRVVHGKGIPPGQHLLAEAVVGEAHAGRVQQTKVGDLARRLRGHQCGDAASHRMTDQHHRPPFRSRDLPQELRHARTLRDVAVVGAVAITQVAGPLGMVAGVSAAVDGLDCVAIVPGVTARGIPTTFHYDDGDTSSRRRGPRRTAR